MGNGTSTILRGMGQSPNLETATLRSELSRLYRRRLVVDELIRSLERYAASDARRPAGKAKKMVTPIVLRNTA